MNTNYQRKFRTQSHPSVQPAQLQQTYHPTYQQVYQQPAATPARKPRQQRRKRRSLFATLLMIIGGVTLLVLLMRYAIVPLLVKLPQWFGGAA